MGLTNLEALLSSLIGFYTRRAANGSVTTTANFVQLSTTSIPAQLVYIFNTSGKKLFVSQDAGNTYVIVPDGNVIPFNAVSNLNSVWIKIEDNTSGTLITYRYEY